MLNQQAMKKVKSLSEERLIIEGLVNGKEAYFLIDTGASVGMMDYGSAPMTMLPLLFWGAFLMHHPYMKQEDASRILFDGLHGLSTEEAEYLGKLYSEPFKTLIAGEDEGKAENPPRKMSVKI